MKLAMVTPYWFPVRGGPTTYVAELAAELWSHGHEVVVVAREGEARGAMIIPGSGRAFVGPAAAFLEDIRPDVVHAHGHWYALAAGLRYARRHPGCRVVFTLHTAFPRRSWWWRYAFRILMSRADFVTAVSGNLLRETLEMIRARVRTRVTYPGVGETPILREERKAILGEMGLAGRAPLVGYLGQLSWPKKVQGLEELIRAMSIVREAMPTATLIIGGDGPHRERLERLAAREAPGGIVFLGDVPDPAPRFFTALDCYAHISYQEGLPLALLEAMACETPVVASAVGGIPEVIRDGTNGFLVSNDPKEIAGRIVQVLQSPELQRRLRDAARADVSVRFTWPRTAERLLPLYGAPTRHRVVVTVDLERDYHAPAGSHRGVTEAMPRLLALFDRHGIRAHVFATSDLASSFPEALRDIARRGHEVGCHAESHDVEYLSSKPYAWQLAAIRRATEALERCTGVRPRSFRAPNFSANGDTIRVLEELGYRYDSSVLPGRVVRAMRVLKLLDFLMAPRDPYHPSREDPAMAGDAGLWEIPVAENPFSLGGPIGLGYVNASGVDKALEAVARSAADPCVVLIHPWELLDPPPGRVPAWMKTGCTADAAKLDAFLGRLRREHEVVTFDELPGLTDSRSPARAPA